jgi:hypothetical protein
MSHGELPTQTNAAVVLRELASAADEHELGAVVVLVEALVDADKGTRARRH